MALEIRLLGELAVIRDGSPVALPASKKTRALLAYLAATGRPQARERLCTLLWDGPDDPRAALRWSLTKLRAIVDEPGAMRLRADRERVELVAAGAAIDVATLRGAVPGGAAGVARASTEALSAIAPLVVGEPFEGLDLADCYRFDDWLRGEREAIRRLGVAVLAALVERLRVAAPERALDHARAWLALEPVDEVAHAAAIELYSQLGRADDGLAHYERCARLIERELGRKPSREIERIRIALGTARAATPAPMPPPAPAAVPLVGRIAERAQLAAALDGLPGQLVLLVGEPGIGKTRLLDELAAMARERRADVLRGRGVEAERIRPYGAWIDALGGDAAFRANATDDRARLFDAIAASLIARGDLLVIFDDVQWLDEGSAALVHYIARLAGRVRIACAARPGELADNQPSLRMVRALARERALHQIELAPLGPEDTRALAAAYAPGVDCDRVFVESGGHPLFAVEIARAIVRGDEHRESLDVLLADRLELLDGVAAELVPWAAALGGAFSADTLAAIAGLSLADLARGVAELERLAIVRAQGADWEFAHDLLRAAAYRRISEPRRRLLHLQIARTLVDLPDPEGERAIDVARHAQLAGDARLCARACLAAARRCQRLVATEQASTYAARGLEHAARLTGEERAQLRIELLVVAYAARLDRARRASIAADLERAIVDARAAGCHAAAARGLNELSRTDYDAGDFARARARSLDAMVRVRADDDPENQGRTLAFSAQCIALLGRDFAQAEEIATEAASLLGPVDDCAELPFALAVIRHHQGDDAAALALANRAAALAVADGRYWLAGCAWSRCALIEVTRGHAREALAYCDELREHAHKLGDAGDVPFGATLAACARWQLGTRDPAALDAALAALRAADAPALLAAALTCVAELELATGELAAADVHAQEAAAVADRAERASEAVLARSVVARVAAAAGRTVEAPRAADRDLLGARARAALDEVELLAREN